MVASVWKNGMMLSCVALASVRSPVLGASPVCTADDGCPFSIEPNTSIRRYLSPRLFEDPETLREVGRRVSKGELVLIRDAFLPEFAELMHQALDEEDGWELYENYEDEDGFHYHHHNLYDVSQFSKVLNDTFDVMNHLETKRFMEELTGRDCSGPMVANPSYYQPGDHSLPHTDYLGDRTLAFVWHLSKNWIPQWGGALFWANDNMENAFQHASFNTLSLFSVTPHSGHFVTTVSPHAEEKRLTFNGWYDAGYMPNIEDPLEEMYATHEQRLTLTFNQAGWIYDEMDTSVLDDPARQKALEKLRQDLETEQFPDPVALHKV